MKRFSDFLRFRERAMRPALLVRGFRNGRIGNRMCSSSSLVEGDVEEERIRDEIEVGFVFVFLSR